MKELQKEFYVGAVSDHEQEEVTKGMVSGAGLPGFKSWHYC